MAKWVAFQVQTVDVAANKKPVQIWIVPLNGGAPQQITHDGEANQRAALVARFQADRVPQRSRRIVADLADGSGRRQRQAGDQSAAPKPTATCFSGDGKNLVFTSEVYPECGADDACNQKLLDAEKANKVEGAHLHRTALPALDAVAGEAAQPHSGDAGGRRRGEGSDARHCATCRRFRWAATISTSRPTARKSATA